MVASDLYRYSVPLGATALFRKLDSEDGMNQRRMLRKLDEDGSWAINSWEIL